MHATDSAGAHRPAHVLAAFGRRTVVWVAGAPVVDPRPPVAQGVAPPQVGVEPIENVDPVLELA
jgi:hypothetical protein